MDKQLEVSLICTADLCEMLTVYFQSLAPRYFSTLFLRADVANVPFLVTKLEIKVLPCVICFVDGVTKDRCATILFTNALLTELS